MRRALIALATAAAAVASAAPVEADYTDVTGPYAVSTLTDEGPNGEYYIFQPTTLTDDTHPLAVFCVGTGGSPANAQTLFESLASHGIVVIAGTDPDQGEGDQAMAGIEWLIDQDTTPGSPYYGKLLTSRVLAFGLSQGGNAALWTAIRENEAAAGTIGSVLALAPGASPQQAAMAPVSEIDVPVLYIAGGLDVIVPPANVYELYEDNASPAWFAIRKGGVHQLLHLNARVGLYIRAWAMAHLYGDVAAASEFYGDPWGLGEDGWFKDQERKNLDL